MTISFRPKKGCAVVDCDGCGLQEEVYAEDFRGVVQHITVHRWKQVKEYTTQYWFNYCPTCAKNPKLANSWRKAKV